jgi:hypothetical protein
LTVFSARPSSVAIFGQFIDHDIALQEGHFAKPAELVEDDQAVLVLKHVRALKNSRTATVELDRLCGAAALQQIATRFRTLATYS